MFGAEGPGLSLQVLPFINEGGRVEDAIALKEDVVTKIWKIPEKVDPSNLILLQKNQNSKLYDFVNGNGWIPLVLLMFYNSDFLPELSISSFLAYLTIMGCFAPNRLQRN